MDASPKWRWLLLAAAIVAAFLGVVSVTMERLHGWSFIGLCFVAGLLGAVGYLWARDHLLPTWERLSKARRIFLVGLIIAIVLAGRLIANRHKPDEQFADVMIGIGVLAAVGLVGIYRKISHL